MPKISVLMPVYKTPPHYLKDAITSILNQSFSDFSKHSSGTAIYVRRNEAKNTDKKEDSKIPKPKVNQITDFRHYSKVNRKTK